MFYDLLNEAFGSLDNLEKLEKEYRRVKQQIQLKNDNMILSYSALLPKTPSIHLKNKDQKQERMRRARSMPKMNEQDIVSILSFDYETTIYMYRNSKLWAPVLFALPV